MISSPDSHQIMQTYNLLERLTKNKGSLGNYTLLNSSIAVTGNGTNPNDNLFNRQDDASGLSSGAKAAIVIVSLAALVLLCYVVYFVYKRCKKGPVKEFNSYDMDIDEKQTDEVPDREMSEKKKEVDDKQDIYSIESEEEIQTRKYLEIRHE
jgi:hypothetical protein